MSILSSYDWESDSWTHHNDNPARNAFREAVAEIAEKAKATLPECNGRVDSAVKMVLNNDVELLADGTAKVASQSHGTTKYFIVNGECSCKDYQKAPSNWCKHRIAAGLAKRVAARLRAQWDTQANGQTAHQPAPEQPQDQPQPVIPPVETPVRPESEPVIPEIPTAEVSVESDAVPIVPQSAHWAVNESPASCTLKFQLYGVELLYTMRDVNDEKLYARVCCMLPRILEKTSQGTNGTGGTSGTNGTNSTAPSQPDENLCPIHRVPFKRYSKGGKSWLSHKCPDGSWCNSKNNRK